MFSSLQGALSNAATTAASTASGAASVVSSKLDALPAEQVVQAVLDALTQASQAAVAQVSAIGGFSQNDLLRVPLPEKIRGPADTLAKVPGAGDKIEELKAALNRAAELACAVAFAIFKAALAALSLSDAKALVLSKDQEAATHHFDTTCRGDLKAQFTPIVRAKTQEVGVLALLEQLKELAGKLPVVGASLAAAFDVDVVEHVTAKALNGLFVVVGTKEKEIRASTTGRVTPALQAVFGAVDSK